MSGPIKIGSYLFASKESEEASNYFSNKPTASTSAADVIRREGEPRLLPVSKKVLDKSDGVIGTITNLGKVQTYHLMRFIPSSEQSGVEDAVYQTDEDAIKAALATLDREGIRTEFLNLTDLLD